MTQKQKDIADVIKSIRINILRIEDQVSVLASSIADDFPNTADDLYSVMDRLTRSLETLECRTELPLS